MKARINPRDRIPKKRLAEAEAVAKDMVWKERQHFARRIFKLWAYVNHDEFGVGVVRGMRAIDRINWLMEEAKKDEVFWYHIDQELKKLGYNFEDEDYEVLDR